jgi:hypothetical protein
METKTFRRMVNELCELTTRIARLEKWMNELGEIDEEYLKLCEQQLNIMHSYSEVLRTRIMYAFEFMGCDK